MLVDPGNMLKAAPRPKDALVLRCNGMILQSGQGDKGEWLKITYYGEDGADVNKRFRLYTPVRRTISEQLSTYPHTRTLGIPLRWIATAGTFNQQMSLRHSDFVMTCTKG